MSESFTFEVAYGTAFEQLETLRERMLTFLGENKRDYQPAFDVSIDGEFRNHDFLSAETLSCP
jgi:small-conductance mechanosensitive channel